MLAAEREPHVAVCSWTSGRPRTRRWQPEAAMREDHVLKESVRDSACCARWPHSTTGRCGGQPRDPGSQAAQRALSLGSRSVLGYRETMLDRQPMWKHQEVPLWPGACGSLGAEQYADRPGWPRRRRRRRQGAGSLNAKYRCRSIAINLNSPARPSSATSIKYRDHQVASGGSPPRSTASCLRRISR